MNRQFRRANEKSDKKREREKARGKVGAYARRAPVRKEQPKVKTDPKKNVMTPQERRSDFRTSSRFTGIMALVTTVLILMGAFFRVPDPNPTVLTVVSEVGLFFIFGYFVAHWLLRTGVKNALAVAVSSGIVLATLVEGAQFFLIAGTPEPFKILLAAPLVVAGAFVGRFIYRKTIVS